MRAIFISYRRDDAEGEAGRLFDDLIAEFGVDKVFMDVAGIEPGRDFRKVIDQHVASCGVLLAMIGKSWVNVQDESGQRRLDNPLDFVRLETSSALKRDIPVIPVLVHGGHIPRPEQLPDDLKDLAYRNGVELTHARWDSDVQLLIKALRQHLGQAQERAREKTDVASVSTPGGTTKPVILDQPAKWPRRNRITVGIVSVVAIAIAISGFRLYQYIQGEQARSKKATADAAARQSAEDERLAAEKEAATKTAARKPSSEQNTSGGVSTHKQVADKEAATKAKATKEDGQGTGRRASAESPTIFAGTWMNDNPNTRSLPKLIIAQAGTKVSVHAFGASHPSYCDWGTQDGTAQDRTASLTWNQGFVVRDMKLTLDSPGHLRSVMESVYTDSRPRRSEEEFFHSEAAQQTVAATVPSAPPASSRPEATIRDATCTNLGSGQFRIGASGDAYAPLAETHILYMELTVTKEGNGIRWRPNCGSWGAAQPADTGIWEVSCIHRPNDSPKTTWDITRTVQIADAYTPNKGLVIVRHPETKSGGAYSPFEFTCR